MSLRFSLFSGSDSSVKVKVVGVSATVALDGASTLYCSLSRGFESAAVTAVSDVLATADLCCGNAFCGA